MRFHLLRAWLLEDDARHSGWPHFLCERSRFDHRDDVELNAISCVFPICTNTQARPSPSPKKKKKGPPEKRGHSLFFIMICLLNVCAIHSLARVRLFVFHLVVVVVAI